MYNLLKHMYSKTNIITIIMVYIDHELKPSLTSEISLYLTDGHFFPFFFSFSVVVYVGWVLCVLFQSKKNYYERILYYTPFYSFWSWPTMSSVPWSLLCNYQLHYTCIHVSWFILVHPFFMIVEWPFTNSAHLTFFFYVWIFHEFSHIYLSFNNKTNLYQKISMIFDSVWLNVHIYKML